MTTKKSDTPAGSGQLLVYGLDEAGKPKGARFPATEIDRVSPVATALKLKSCQPCSDEVASLGLKLPVGRIYARGKAFIPHIKRDLYDKLLAALASGQKADEPKPQQTSKPLPDQQNGKATAECPTEVQPILPPLASGLPQNWESVAAGNMLLIDAGPGEGWWEAIVISRDDEILTLRYRDFPKVPKFQRHLSTVALINPRPA